MCIDFISEQVSEMCTCFLKQFLFWIGSFSNKQMSSVIKGMLNVDRWTPIRQNHGSVANRLLSNKCVISVVLSFYDKLHWVRQIGNLYLPMSFSNGFVLAKVQGRTSYLHGGDTRSRDVTGDLNQIAGATIWYSCGVCERNVSVLKQWPKNIFFL